MSEATEALLRTLDDATLAEVKVPTAEEIRAAFERSAEQFRKAALSSRPTNVRPAPTPWTSSP